MNPFKESRNNARAARHLFPVLATFVAPMFPEPTSLKFIPFILVMIKLNGIEPNM